MKYIANVITKYRYEKFSDFVLVTDSLTNVDLSLPTLIVGWEEAKSFFPEANILNHTIKDDIMWTFSPRERRNEYERDCEEFKRRTIKVLSKKINYKYFNIFAESCDNIKKVIRYIKKKQSIIFVTYNMLYLLYGEKIIGFSLDDAEYIGIKKEKIINLIKGNKLIFNNSFLGEIDKRTFYDNNVIVPYLYSLTV